MTPRTCLLVEDQPGAAAWLSGLLGQAFPGIAVTHAADLRRGLRGIEGAAPDLALVDLGLPDGTGVDLIRALAERSPQTLAVVATIYDDDAHLFDALAAGARGYLLKNEEGQLLVGYLRRISAGEPPLSPAIANRILAHFSRRAPAAADEADLTAREVEVLTLLARGLTSAEVARMLGLKAQTIAGYVKVIYQKLNVSSRAEATLAAVRRGLV